MWNRVKRLFGGREDAARASADAPQDGFRWYEVGEDGNPFGVRMLDVRSLTWTVLSTTQDPAIAESFNAQRSNDGRMLAHDVIANAITTPCDLIFPHNGEPLEGIVSKADAMETKWDIYAYDSMFLFARSWTGQLYYRASFEVSADRLRIVAVESPADGAENAPQTVRFLLATHAMGRVLPHPIPAATPDDPKRIALLSFSMFGRHACYATYDDTTAVPLAAVGASA